jgi:hypothetical protein
MPEKNDLPEFWTPFWTPGMEEKAIVGRLFLRAAERIGSASALARLLGLTYTAIRPYLAGEAVPSEDLLLRTVAVVVDELPALKQGFSDDAWSSLSLPERPST